jgi:hypothetical protein
MDVAAYVLQWQTGLNISSDCVLVGELLRRSDASFSLPESRAGMQLDQGG